MNVLVVGGAGYIGSHCVRQLAAAGHRPVVLDSLVYGHRAAVAPAISFHSCDLGDETALARILAAEQIELVMHFAAFAYVGESVTDPLKYYFNNTVATLQLLRAMLRAGVKKFVFSSTCATYGVPPSLPMTEATPQAPINPYGQTKLDVENALKNLARAHGLSFAAFRYFNAAGAATDGTCLRDYVHVDDLARAHIAVFPKLASPGAGFFYNLGTGTPTSVREVIRAVEQVTGLKVPVNESPRRAGDPPALYADATKARAELHWEPEFKTIEPIVASAWKWHQSHPRGYNDR